jgi:hypothetical protein
VADTLSITDDTILARHPEAAFRIYQEEGVVVLPAGAEVHVLNPVGARIWELLDGQRTVTAITEAILAEYEVSREAARADVHEFLAALAEKGMIVPGT